MEHHNDHKLADLLNGVADATHELITNKDYVAAISNTLGILGEAINSDVVFMFENHQAPDPDSGGRPTCSLRFYWRAQMDEQPVNIEMLQHQSYNPEWYYHLEQGKSLDIYLSATSQDIQEILKYYELKSAFLIPVLAYGKFWGFLGIGTDQLERTFSQIEENALKTMAGTLVNFFESKRNEKAFRESEHRFKQILQNNPAIKMVIDPFDGSIRDAGYTTCTFYGYDYTQLTQLSLYDLTTHSPEEVDNFLTQAVRHHRSRFNFRHLKADGSAVDVELLTSPVYLNGTTYIFAIVVPLMSHQTYDNDFSLSADALLQRFIRFTHAAAAVIDQQTRVLHASTRWLSYFNLNDKDWRHQPIEQNIPYLPDSWKEAIKTTLNGSVQNGITGRPVNDSKHRAHMRLDGYPWYHSNGTVKGAILFADFVAGTERPDASQKVANKRIHPVNDTIEKERKHIAQELHDSIGQILSATHFNVEMLEQIQPENPDNWKNQLGHVKKLLDTAIHEVRNITNNLRPVSLDDFGLIAALDNLVNSYQNTTRIQLKFQSYGFKTPLSDTLGTTIFRICQEALNNILRHSNATTAHIDLYERDDTVLLLIQDNGKGLPDHLLNGDQLTIHSDCQGLCNIKERVEKLNGRINVDSHSNRGTELIIELPLLKDNNLGTKNSQST